MNPLAATRIHDYSSRGARDYLAHVLAGYRHPKKIVVWVHEQNRLRGKP